MLCMVLAGCDGLKGLVDTKDYTYEETREIVEEVLDEIPVEVTPYTGDLSPLPLVENIEGDETESLYNFKEGEPDQIISVTLKDQPDNPMEVVNYTPKNDDVYLRDENDNQIPFNFLSYENGVAHYKVPVSNFSEDHFYHFELRNDDLKFVKKDPSIRDLTYYSLNVTDENRVNEYEKNDEPYENYDDSIVQYYDVDAFGSYFVTDKNLNLTPGKMFRISDKNIDHDTRDTIYGRFKSKAKNPNGAGYIIRYDACSAHDVYKTIDVLDQMTVNEDNIGNLETYTDGESIENRMAKAFVHNPDTVAAVLGVMEHYEVEPRNMKRSAFDWASKVNLSFDLNFADDTFTWGAQLTLTINPEDYLQIKIIFDYKETTKYDISASLDIDYEFIIPVGVDYKLVVKETDTKEVGFKLVLSTTWNPYSEEKIDDGINKDLSDALNKNKDFKSKFTGESPTASAAGMSYPLIRFDIYYFFPLDIRFEVDFYWELQLTFETDIRYLSTTTRTDVSISNKKGADPSSETEAKTENTLRLYFMGSFHAECGLQVSFGLGISGLYKFFHAEVYIKAYGAIDAQGYLLIDFTWGDDEGLQAFGTMGGKFEITAGAKWGIDVDLLFTSINLEWPVKVWTLIGFCSDNSLANFVEPEATLEVTNTDFRSTTNDTYDKAIDLDQYHYLYLEAFDAKEFSTHFVDFDFEDTISTRYGSWLTPNEIPYFSAEVINEQGNPEFALDEHFNLTLVGDPMGFEEFTATIVVTVDPDLIVSGIDKLTKTITVHFTNNDKQTVYVKEPDSEEKTCVGTFIEGQSTLLPVPTPPKYMKFVGWKNLSTSEEIPYNQDNPTENKYTIPDVEGPTEVTFEYMYVPHYYYEITWVDGFGNIVQIDHVWNDETITEIAADKRDRFMISSDENYEYVFVGYDTDFVDKTPTENMTIRAIYEYRAKAGE